MMVILIALFLTFLWGYIIETIRMRAEIKQVKNLGKDIKMALVNFLCNYNSLDVYVIKSLRDFIESEFKEKKIIDDFNVYLNEDNKIIFVYKIDRVVQEIDLELEQGKYTAEFISLDYLDTLIVQKNL